LIHFICLKFKSTWILRCAMNHIPLEHYLKVIPKSTTGLQNDGTAKVETGIKFHAIYKLFQKNKIEGGRNRNKVFLDLQYYCELGHFFKKQHENEQPQFYQTNTEDYDYFEEELKPLLAKKFKSITGNWKKLDKEKLFLKTRKKDELPKPSKELEKWIKEFDSIVVITQNLMWNRETTNSNKLILTYSTIIKDTIKQINKFAKLVHSTSKANEEYVEAVFIRMPFPITF
jgi:hypothetical protein